VARAFYADGLGMTEVAKPPLLAVRGGCWFVDGDAELHVGVDRDFRPARKAHPAFVVATWTDARKPLRSRGSR
jgi:hypothetical protein